MNNFQLQNLQPYLFLVCGLALMLYAFFKKSQTISNGEKAEGIVFELGRKSGHNSSLDYNVNNIVTVRFVTKKLEWITAEYKSDFAFFYTGQYKIGDKIDILYNSDNPNEFLILTKQSETRTRLILIIAASGSIIIGTFQLFNE